jgi:diaminohydroxyphosphoribosylaminopyrimidine deaminase/5-amino-6-(5-phosphoribosylamino)uracil reductase
MQQQARALNPGFISRMVNRRPFVRSKIAASLDGKTALANGLSQWITGPAARRDVQHWRAQSCALLTGIGTILKDNPSLTVREIPIERQPISVVIDSDLRIPLTAKILQNPSVLIAFARDHGNKAKALSETGASLLCIPDEHGQVCLSGLLSHLGSNEVNEVMVEGGEALNGALMRLKLIDELVIYYAPKLMGGDSKNMFAFSSLQTMEDAIPIHVTDIRLFGDDIRILARCG